MSVGELITAGLLTELGGETHNPHRKIDHIGAAVAHYCLPHAFHDGPVDIRIEEEGMWTRYPGNDQGESRYRIVIDPLDGTSDIARGRPYQAMGLLMTDTQGHFAASCVVGLSQPEILVADHNHAALLFCFHEGRTTLEPISLHRNDAVQTPLRVSVLKRRLTEHPEAYAFIDDSGAELTLDTFGGAGLLALVCGKVDAMIDLIKGQIWYEALPWGWTAEAIGCPVTAPDGSAIDFAGMLNESLADPDYRGRQQIVISRNREVADALVHMQASLA
jgi:fructose-1,6-bisphosphatase/inositol monophosphatase family enzyme